jgi:hypothetical protein
MSQQLSGYFSLFGHQLESGQRLDDILRTSKFQSMNYVEKLTFVEPGTSTAIPPIIIDVAPIPIETPPTDVAAESRGGPSIPAAAAGTTTIIVTRLLPDANLIQQHAPGGLL